MFVIFRSRLFIKFNRLILILVITRISYISVGIYNFDIKHECGKLIKILNESPALLVGAVDMYK